MNPRTTDQSIASKLEDPGNYRELPRTPAVKDYDAGRRGLSGRVVVFMTLALMLGGFAVWLIVRYIGIAGVGPTTGDQAREAFILTSIGWLLLTIFYVLPILIIVYRPRWVKVSRKQKQPPRGE